MANINSKEKHRQIAETGATSAILGCIAGGLICAFINKPDLAIPAGLVIGLSFGLLGAVRKWAQFPGL